MRMKALLPLPFLLLLLSLFSPSSATNNITEILASHPDFSTFSSLCTQTGVASQIFSRTSVTVLAVPNSILDPIVRSATFSASTLYDIISFHVLLDFFDIAKFKAITNGTTLSTTLYQTSGRAIGKEGFVNITIRGSAIDIGKADSAVQTVSVVSDIYSAAYNISVVSVSNVLLPTGVGAPEPAVAPTPILPPGPAPLTTPTSAPSPTPASSPVPTPTPSSAPSPTLGPAPALAPGPVIPSPPAPPPPATTGPTPGESGSNPSVLLSPLMLGTVVLLSGSAIIFF